MAHVFHGGTDEDSIKPWPNRNTGTAMSILK
jgi:hypothetical protein